MRSTGLPILPTQHFMGCSGASKKQMAYCVRHHRSCECVLYAASFENTMYCRLRELRLSGPGNCCSAMDIPLFVSCTGNEKWDVHGTRARWSIPTLTFMSGTCFLFESYVACRA